VAWLCIMGFGTSISFKVLPVSSFDSGDDEMRRGCIGQDGDLLEYA
jgi:hypothetical protein